MRIRRSTRTKNIFRQSTISSDRLLVMTRVDVPRKRRSLALCFVFLFFLVVLSPFNDSPFQSLCFSGNEIEIQAGEHKFPFTCTLPENLPSSFESDFGHVRYTVKAILDRPWKFDQEVKAAFTIVLPFDLNQEPRTSVGLVIGRKHIDQEKVK